MSNKDVLDIVLDEIRNLRQDVKKLNDDHVNLRMKLYGICLILGSVGHDIKDLIFKKFF